MVTHKQEFLGMKSFIALFLGLTLTVGMVGCKKDETKPVEPAAPADGTNTPAETPAETPAP